MFENSVGRAGRPVGVGIPTGQRAPVAETGAPLSVANLVRADTYAVQFYDTDGRLQPPEMVHRIGNRWYRAPNGANYAATLRVIASDSKLVKNLEERLASEDTTSIPKEDAVDVLGGG